MAKFLRSKINGELFAVNANMARHTDVYELVEVADATIAGAASEAVVIRDDSGELTQDADVGKPKAKTKVRAKSKAKGKAASYGDDSDNNLLSDLDLE